MKTSSFEVQFTTRLRDHIVSHYPDLHFSVTRSTHQPDIVIENARAHHAFWIQVAGGNNTSPLPVATISVLIEMSTEIHNQHIDAGRAEIWLVSNAQILPPWVSILEEAQIKVVNAGSVEDALARLDPPLRALAKKN